MKPYSILVNGKPVQLLELIPDKITSLSVNFTRLPISIRVSPQQVSVIEAWLQELVANTTADYMVYNNTITKIADLKAKS